MLGSCLEKGDLTLKPKYPRAATSANTNESEKTTPFSPKGNEARRGESEVRVERDSPAACAPWGRAGR